MFVNTEDTDITMMMSIFHVIHKEDVASKIFPKIQLWKLREVSLVRFYFVPFSPYHPRRPRRRALQNLKQGSKKGPGNSNTRTEALRASPNLEP